MLNLRDQLPRLLKVSSLIPVFRVPFWEKTNWVLDHSQAKLIALGLGRDYASMEFLNLHFTIAIALHNGSKLQLGESDVESEFRRAYAGYTWREPEQDSEMSKIRPESATGIELVFGPDKPRVNIYLRRISALVNDFHELVVHHKPTYHPSQGNMCQNYTTFIQAVCLEENSPGGVTTNMIPVPLTE